MSAAKVSKTCRGEDRFAQSIESLRIRRADLDSPNARRLIAALNAELAALYPEPGATHFSLAAEEVDTGKGAFLIGYLKSDAVACGAIRCRAAGVAEIKRMYVAPALRGRGIAERMLAALEQQARQLAVVRLVLETGNRQPAAIALYHRAGFIPIARFGEYRRSTLSLCMGKDLSGGER